MEKQKKVDEQGLGEKEKSMPSLSNSEVMEALEFSGYDDGQIGKLYESLESSGVEVSG